MPAPRPDALPVSTPDQKPTDAACHKAAMTVLFLEIMGWKLPSTPTSLQPEAPEEKE